MSRRTLVPAARALVTAAVTAALLLAPATVAAADDGTPPTAPGTPIFSNVTPFSVTLTWAHSTDDVEVTHYLVRRTLLNGQTWNDSTTGANNTITIRDLTPNQNYSFTVIATDAAANTASSATASVRTQPYTGGPMCSISYQPLSSGSGSFYGRVEMTNLSPGAWQEWTLGFTLAANQQVNPAWGFQQNGTRWTADFVWLWSSGAGPLLPGNSRSVEFSGTSTGSGNPPPTDFTINDHPCGLVGQPIPPGQPQNLVISNLTPGTASIEWSAATPGTNPISHYEVLVNGLRYTCIGVVPLGCLLAGLTPATTYAVSVRAVDTTGLVGPATTISLQTPPSTPPSTPGSPAVSDITTTGATLTWAASTPGSFPLAGYIIYRVTGSTETAIAVTATPSTTTKALTGLIPNTAYSFRIRARDTAGVLSAPSATVSFTTGSVAGCDVEYSKNDWGDGFTATVKITNISSSTINGWTLRFAFPSGQRLTHGWSATWSQPTGSPNVTATSLSWNATIQSGQSVSIGFNGSHNGTNPRPTAFSLNDGACTIAGA